MAASGAAPYIATKAIKAAAAGRETEVVDALGIAWRNGHPHIPCPYSSHDDHDPSWRWDDKRSRAYCTCIAKSDGILDVIAKVLGLDFEAAKLRAAELIGRGDLIKVKGDGAGQKTDAASLLNPPQELRDDGLVQRYLAARLGLDDPAAAPLPTTRAVGWRALPYFDPPETKGGKPKLAASPPCAVFETVAADGRRHAHRIYLNAERTGKAELGALPGGKVRDAKKSARVVDGQPSTAGCSVVWGEPAMDIPASRAGDGGNASLGGIRICAHCGEVMTTQRAGARFCSPACQKNAHRAQNGGEPGRWIIAAEGIETAAAIAYAFAPEIAKGRLRVLSAITAGGIEALAPWPAGRVTIAADRDEAKPGGGFKRGERAARTFALRQGKQYDVQLALPGEPGSGCDFLDLLRAEGISGVRAAILAAEPMVPTEAEIGEHESQVAARSEIERIAAAYPLPPMETLHVEYRPTRHNGVWVHKIALRENKDTGEKREIAIPVCSPFGAVALLVLQDADRAYGLRVAVRDMRGDMRLVEIERGEQARLGGSDIRARLRAAGLRIEQDGESVALQLLSAANPPAVIAAVHRAGWHRPALNFTTEEVDDVAVSDQV